VEALVGCVAGATLIDTTRMQMQKAGLVDIELTPKDGYVDAMTQWNDPLYAAVMAELPDGAKASDYVTSLDIAARAPRASGRCC
jgi:outer membrane lipoprotein SlyB